MSERRAKLLDRIFELTGPGDELWSEMTTGPETEDTEAWLKTDTGVDVWERIVYPAMAALPSTLLRTLSFTEARVEIDGKLGKISDEGLFWWYETKWTLISIRRRPFDTPLEFRRDPAKPDLWRIQYTYDVVEVQRQSPSLYVLTINRKRSPELDHWPAAWTRPE